MAYPARLLARRPLLLGAAGAALAATAAQAQQQPAAPPAAPPYDSISGVLPPLSFRMTLASTGAAITESAFRGHPVILYFGFTRCTDTCPLTMENATKLVRGMGPDGQRLRVLFVTIDPAYDTVARLKAYMANFGPPPVFDGLRGTPDQLASVARQYGVGYHAVTSPDGPDPVSAISHTDAVYGFGPDGQARYILGSLATARPDIATLARIMTPLATT